MWKNVRYMLFLILTTAYDNSRKPLSPNTNKRIQSHTHTHTKTTTTTKKQHTHTHTNIQRHDNLCKHVCVFTKNMYINKSRTELFDKNIPHGTH